MPVQHTYPPGRLQLFSRHGIAKRPELLPVISAGGDAVVNQTTGDVYANVTAFLAQNQVSPHYVLRYIEGPFKGKTLPNARLMENAVLENSDQPKRSYAHGRVQVHSRSGYPRTPPIFAFISETGKFIHEGSGTVYRSKRHFLLGNSVPPNYVSVS